MSSSDCPRGRRGSVSSSGTFERMQAVKFVCTMHIYVCICIYVPSSPMLQIGHIEGQPERKGVFPVSFVHILSD